MLKIFTQKLDQPDSRYFVGKGKLEEIKTSGHETVHLSIFEGNPRHKIPAHVDLDADKDFRCVLEVRK